MVLRSLLRICRPILLQKLSWAGLRTSNGLDAESFVSKFELTLDDYDELNSMYVADGDVQRTACLWIHRNEDKWREWISFPQRAQLSGPIAKGARGRARAVEERPSMLYV